MCILLKSLTRPVLVLLCLLLVGCESSRQSSKLDDTHFNAVINNNLDVAHETVLGRQVNAVLLAELYNHLGQSGLSVDTYSTVALNSLDPAIIKRATEIAASSGFLNEALELARHWIGVSPNNLEARQYLALLNLRVENYQASARELNKIVGMVQQKQHAKGTSTTIDYGLKFIGTLLNVESHHKKSLLAYQQYLKNYAKPDNETQQNLVLAALAMKAKQYPVVVQKINAVMAKETEMSSKLVLMKARALQKQGKNHDAAFSLKQYVDNYRVEDSTRLELVRLLIIDGQKQLAGEYLVNLVEKHPDNMDLLKSMIALEIDQQKFKSAELKLHALKRNQDYFSDATYFKAEILEAKGELKEAFNLYKKVTDGRLYKRAINKIKHLSIQLEQDTVLRKVNYKKSIGSNRDVRGANH